MDRNGLLGVILRRWSSLPGSLRLWLRRFVTGFLGPAEQHERACAIPRSGTAAITGGRKFARRGSRGQNYEALALRTRHPELMGGSQLRLFHGTSPPEAVRAGLVPLTLSCPSIASVCDLTKRRGGLCTKEFSQTQGSPLLNANLPCR